MKEAYYQSYYYALKSRYSNDIPIMEGQVAFMQSMIIPLCLLAVLPCGVLDDYIPCEYIACVRGLIISLIVLLILAGEDTIGYTITFTKSGPVTIYNGKDGKDGNDGLDGQDGEDGNDGADGKDGADGYTPQIGVKLDEDGIYYWTLDGEWLLDDAGNKMYSPFVII